MPVKSNDNRLAFRVADKDKVRNVEHTADQSVVSYSDTILDLGKNKGMTDKVVPPGKLK
jgi:hypothetical protein